MLAKIISLLILQDFEPISLSFMNYKVLHQNLSILYSLAPQFYSFHFPLIFECFPLILHSLKISLDY